MQRLIYAIDQLSKTVGHAFAWCIIILTLGTCYEVFVRYVLERPDQLGVRHELPDVRRGVLHGRRLHAVARRPCARRHVLSAVAAARTQASVELVLYVLFFFPGILALVIAGWGYGFESMRHPRGQRQQPGRRADLAAQDDDSGRRRADRAAGLRRGAALRACACATAHWPARLHDVEELEKQILAGARAQGRGLRQGAAAMSDPGIALVMLGILVFAIMIGFPVAFTLMALGVGFGYYAYYQAGQAFFDNRVFYLLTQNTFTVLNNDALVSIPLFLLMGYLVERANILDNLFKSLQIALKRSAGLAGGGDARHLRAVRHRHRHRRRGGDADGPARVPADDQGRLRHAARLGRGLRRRLPRHPDPAVDHADRLWRDGGHLGGQALRRRVHSRLLPRRHVHRLRHRRWRSSSRSSRRRCPRSRATSARAKWS